ncbi:hypothetical protein YI53_003915 [Salmonella enterica subsp. enterica]|nr:hypothetical protein [Salmonella enterica subsp. enterica]
MSESLGQAGPAGMSSLSVPLPVSAGRGFAPSLSLNYSSGAGNDIFGVGWSCTVPAVSLRTRHGTPQYQGEDTFLGPDGEVLVAETGSDGKPVTTTINKYGAVTLDTTYTVTRYYPRIEGTFNRFEFWQSGAGNSNFWLLHGRDGTLHMLGKTTETRISDPAEPARTAVWLLQESVSPVGEHIWYQYRAEDSAGLAADGRDHSAMRYISQVRYGNLTGMADLYLWSGNDMPGKQTWLFTLVFDYGERDTDPAAVPPFTPVSGAVWAVRQDPFSRYDDGFEVRTHRLCRQVLMFHHITERPGEQATLVSRFLPEYSESTVMTQLSAVRIMAYEADGALKELPPLEFGYTSAALSLNPEAWTPLPDFPGINDGQRYLLTDLYGEGLPGVLYRAGQDWRYCPPVRDTTQGGDAVTWDTTWRNLPQVPAMQGALLHLTDITGDGHQDLVVAQPGFSGYFTLNSDGTWGSFTPFDALPVEYFHPQSQLAQLTGSGLADLVLVSPGVVRLYTNTGTGFEAGLDVAQGETVTLPVAGRDARAWVGFADIPGSGQAHLTEIRFNQVRFWPNLGHGKFGVPVTLTVPLDTETAFDPERIFLADTDGSGTPDLVYAGHDSLQIFTSLAGNGYAAPVSLPWPAGVTFDRLCQLTPADLYGTGCTGLVLTVPYMTVSHWYYPFVAQKPYLLSSVVNNLGATHTLTYRSSAQYWLDEKQDTPKAVPSLPFPVPVLSCTATADGLTGNTLRSVCRYRQGVYDGKEREFRGFGYLETEDTSTEALPSGDTTPLSAPLLSRTWYHCGREDDSTLSGTPWSGDTQAPVPGTVRLTQWNSTTAQEETFTPDAATAWWMHRALKGMPLRSESWDAGTFRANGAPFACAFTRPQARLVQAGSMPVVMPSALETVQLSYEQLSIDPQITHQVILEQDKYASVLWQASVVYPRRGKQPLKPYPGNLPPDAWDNSYDTQQNVLRIQETRAAVFNLDSAQVWCPGLPSRQRQNLLTAPALPAGGISYETLTAVGGLLDVSQRRYYRGQTEVFYQTHPPVSLPALADHTSTAVLDDVAQQAYDGITELDNFDFTTVGYHSIATFLDVTGITSQTVLAVNSGPVRYDSGDNFYRLLSQQNTDMTNSPRVSLTWDTWSLGILTQTDRMGNVQKAEYDYRFLTPYRVTDINGNTSEVLYDALGRIVSGSYYGTENGAPVGFDPVSDHPDLLKLTAVQAITDALVNGYTQSVATVSSTDMFCWTGQVTKAQLSNDAATAQANWDALLKARYITESGAVRPAGHRWAQSPQENPDIDPTLATVLNTTGGMPVYSVQLTADNYPDKAEQQTQIALSYSDGFGRSLQQCGRVAPGPAWHREDDGEVDTTGVTADPRWVVSGRMEYDNKGQPVRQYRPYFLDDWQYVVDSSLRTQGYSDTLYYDAAGRHIRTVTAAGHLQRITYYPWFTVAEDENDTEGLSDGAHI